MPEGGGGSDRQRERRLVQAAQRLWTEGDGEAANDPSSPAVAGPAGQASYVRLAAGRGSPPRGRGTTRRGAAGGAASSSHGGAAWRAEDNEDWASRGVTRDSVPYVEEVLAVAHSHCWPATVRRMEGCTTVVFPVFEDLADAMEQHLFAIGAVAPDPAPEFWGSTIDAAGGPVTGGSYPPEALHPLPETGATLDPDDEEVSLSTGTPDVGASLSGSARR